MAALIDNSRGIIYDRKIFIVQATYGIKCTTTAKKCDENGKVLITSVAVGFSETVLFFDSA